MKKIELENWTAPEVTEAACTGFMPGDNVRISADHIRKANLLFPRIAEIMNEKFADQKRVTISVCGGSGVGKTGCAALLGAYFEEAGIPGLVISGDNYPRRIPMYNDAERLHLFREGGIRRMVKDGLWTEEHRSVLREWQEEESDADPAHLQEPSADWFSAYIAGGREALTGYLGTAHEQNFAEMNELLEKFHAGEEKIWIRRMGRTETALDYAETAVPDEQVLILEWTHGNNDALTGIDIPVFMNSTPTETMAYRVLRGRDGNADSPFTTMVLEIEQKLLASQAHRAALILSKEGKFLSYSEYCALMEREAKQ